MKFIRARSRRQTLLAFLSLPLLLSATNANEESGSELGSQMERVFSEISSITKNAFCRVDEDCGVLPLGQ